MSDVKAAQGRTQLKGLLDDLVQKSIEGSRDDIIDADVEEAARDLLDLTDDGRGRKRKHGKVGVKQRKKRKRKDQRKGSPDGYDLSNGVRHIPHVMTLFDRKVDLAKFSPDTPLYVMCREWMSNNPECTHATPPSQLCPLTPHTLPLPTPLPMDKEGREVRIDIPKPHPPISKSREEMDNLIREGTSELAGDLGEYRREHLRRWREVRSRWKIASAQNQLRYGSSLEILRGMFQKS